MIKLGFVSAVVEDLILRVHRDQKYITNQCSHRITRQASLIGEGSRPSRPQASTNVFKTLWATSVQYT